MVDGTVDTEDTVVVIGMVEVITTASINRKSSYSSERKGFIPFSFYFSFRSVSSFSVFLSKGNAP
ncbi:hypothetical protein A8709_23030 [Paenibacillus pectinilyticus]|uniref:Uncharacterized protein n=1 Tax=Paenibacillus pectinilyticus TaxID=512399 RepID=A0A1C0ZRN1_9BACL|nr:hypothetical protein A8709_23030 [Paenibacillus pectinilyticus]